MERCIRITEHEVDSAFNAALVVELRVMLSVQSVFVEEDGTICKVCMFGGGGEKEGGGGGEGRGRGGGGKKKKKKKHFF